MDEDISIAKVLMWIVVGLIVISATVYGINWAFRPVDAENQYQTARNSSSRIQSTNEELFRLKTAWMSAKDDQEKTAIVQQVCRVSVSIDTEKLADGVKGFVKENCQ